MVHGLRPKGGGRITVSFSPVEPGKIRYRVTDDGAGITSMDLNDINLCIREDRSDGKYFALINLNRQLRLYYGDNYSFTIDSSPDAGTTVSIDFPKG